MIIFARLSPFWIYSLIKFNTEKRKRREDDRDFYKTKKLYVIYEMHSLLCMNSTRLNGVEVTYCAGLGQTCCYEFVGGSRHVRVVKVDHVRSCDGVL